MTPELKPMSSDQWRPISPCAIIPVFNHHLALQATVEALLANGLAVILVNDGSDSPATAVMESLVQQFSGVSLVSRLANGGKGAAIKDGLAAAKAQGFSHALQVDADGQHNLADVPVFLAAATKRPEALIVGYPVYDQSIPKHRLYGRYASHIWVWINTLSMEIIDSMCGFRVYPVTASNTLIEGSSIGDRMDFDGEFLVRWHWRGLPLVQRPTKVVYPVDGISHFRLWRDNLLISGMHARLFFGMLYRLPSMLWRRYRRPA
jgi:glycosyltransferase involved in cell wall biosynthesis